MLVAGEASGDMHGANLVKELKKLNSNLTFSGLGGNKMKDAGVELYHDMTKLAVVGFFEVLKHYPEIKSCFSYFLKKIDELKPEMVVLIDYPGFNLRLAKEINKRKIKVIYYISPQLWAWKKNRIKLVQKYVDKMLVIFEFEKDFYAQYNINASFVGHPLMEGVLVDKPKEEFLKSVGLKEYKYTIGLLPGSRQKEIENLLPLMLDAAELINKKFPMIQFVIVKAPTVARKLIEKYAKSYKIPYAISTENQYNAINACDICMVASGTATLETAILEKPMVIVYKTSTLTWALAKLFVTIPDIGLVNVVARRRIVPELIQFEAKPSNILKELEMFITDEDWASTTKLELNKVKNSLGLLGANENAAREVLNILSP